jgi:hypothetical protein
MSLHVVGPETGGIEEPLTPHGELLHKVRKILADEEVPEALIYMDGTAWRAKTGTMRNMGPLLDGLGVGCYEPLDTARDMVSYRVGILASGRIATLYGYDSTSVTKLDGQDFTSRVEVGHYTQALRALNTATELNPHLQTSGGQAAAA